MKDEAAYLRINLTGTASVPYMTPEKLLNMPRVERICYDFHTLSTPEKGFVLRTLMNELLTELETEHEGR